ncbi:hypothetical protein LTR85_009840 [Meristemomyces frigidus]|nr:hypothetical protein LTR85_009840 [Meristemomyces frigidus]
MVLPMRNRRRSPHYVVVRHCTYAGSAVEPNMFSLVEGVYESKQDAVLVLKKLRDMIVERQEGQFADHAALEDKYPLAYKRGPIESDAGLMGYGYQLEDEEGCRRTMWIEKVMVTHAGEVSNEEAAGPDWSDTSSDLNEQDEEEGLEDTEIAAEEHVAAEEEGGEGEAARQD